MEINATLIVQAINFGIAYGILRKFVFVPGVALVLEERSQSTALQDEIRRTAERAQQEKIRLAVEWAAEQQKLVARIPQLPEELFVLRRIKPVTLSHEIATEHDRVQMQKTIAQSLVYSIEAK